jgi:type II secretory pathway pseudopilin PulG
MKHESGFSVIEIIFASALFLIFSGAAIIVVLQGFDANRTATETIVANQYAIEGIEAVRSIKNQSYANLVATAGTGLARVPSGSAFVWAFSGSQNQFGPNNKYTRVITISSVNRDASGNIVSSGGSLDPNTKKATATVTWNHTPTRINTVVQTTYFTNWRATAL